MDCSCLRLRGVLAMFFRRICADRGWVVCLCFLQCGIPHRTCRFHCCLAAHQRTRKKDSAEPSFPILWTPPHPPGEIRCGGALLLPRVWSNLGSCIPVQVAHRQFGIWFGYRCSVWYRSRFSWVVGFVSFVFHYWGEGLFVTAAMWGFAMVYSWICADRDWVDCFV